jgi:hypothetical protein
MSICCSCTETFANVLLTADVYTASCLVVARVRYVSRIVVAPLVTIVDVTIALVSREVGDLRVSHSRAIVCQASSTSRHFHYWKSPSL